MNKYFISLDVGGTHCRIALMVYNEHDKLKKLKQEKFGINPDFEDGMRDLSDHIQEVRGSYTIESIGGIFPGLVDTQEGIIRSATNLPKWEGKPIKDVLYKRFHVPIYIFHDVTAAAMGEALYGCGKNKDSFIFMIWGTGIGGAKIERLLGKYHITSFEPGHNVADREGEPCSCGLRGCPELEIGGGSLSKKIGRKLADVSDSDPIWDHVIEIAGQTVINTLAFHQTPYVIFGGGLILKRPFLLEKLKKIEGIEQDVFLHPELKMAELGDDAALYGSVALQQVELI